ncbi:pyruvate:ferredoxin (flavodoxin) oxidoreductase [Leptolyngbya sp. CCNP1308]|uniref:pyruvate:ferredoxin (flavodoxin) oxidoreductase n=1 Tax=Leptolyngbya sp. CCNP1308 TaxID=3110255 RepID=UPI002B219FF2|nr:pyruvate:ferredoxin (flavodoxin) oxidoreductase [Leptolyngbya sp. CCNP1308]MEA5449141.1 pyruvate:ferredoxin (flavodoxin) oxidoreductase [Leptolyngbya sp. CCNP1308]
MTVSALPQTTTATLDGNEAVARVAYALSEVIAIYPITPASPMGEWADAWTATGQPNLWGTVPAIVAMQSEGGVAGAVHGALQTGSLTTTFTASQGLLLMLPNLYKIAGELTPCVIHVAARSLAAQALSIFGDHSDVMAARSTGFGMLCSASVQEAQDLAAIATAATLASRIPLLHFFDGFRTSHEVQKIELLTEEVLRSLIDDELIAQHRQRALSPDHPVIRGTTQNPDVFFQAREAVNSYYQNCPDIIAQVMDRFAQLTGRRYRPFEYYGSPQAERVAVLMGSGCETVQATVDALNAQGENVGLVKVRLYRPFDAQRFVEALPKTVQAIAVLDRTKEPGSAGEPLYLDVLAALVEQRFAPMDSGFPVVVGGRYGLSSKEFTPAMVKAVFDHLRLDGWQPHRPHFTIGIHDDATRTRQRHFTIGIHDDVTHTSLPYDPSFSIEPAQTVRAVFYGLGADGTVGANKNTIKIIGEATPNYAQGYFVYDSKKSGSVTTSHLRFGPTPIQAPYLIDQANLVACHQWMLLDQLDILGPAIAGATFLVNSPYAPEETWHQFPDRIQAQILQKQLSVYAINAYQVAREAGMGNRINTVMQTCFFALSKILPQEEGIAAIQQSIRKTYAKKGAAIVAMNLQAVDQTLQHLYEIPLPTGAQPATIPPLKPAVSDRAPAFVQTVLGPMMQRQGDELPVSALPCDGTYPTGTAQWEKRNIAQAIPVWDPQVCVQCGKCVVVCPHAVIRSKVYGPEQLAEAPPGFKHTAAREWPGQQFTIQVAAEDCTGCGICVDVCPAKNKSIPRLKAINMTPVYQTGPQVGPAEADLDPATPAPTIDLRQQEKPNWDFFLQIPNPDRTALNLHKISQQQMQEPLFEFSGACAGCGETPYLKLLTQLFGDRLLVANATGCSSIYGGNLPTTPWSHNAEGRGPAWSNSLFEDNAEFGLGFRVSIDKQADYAAELLRSIAAAEGLGRSALPTLAPQILQAQQTDEADIVEQRERVAQLKTLLTEMAQTPLDEALQANIQRLLSLADALVKKSVWIVGGDGWAYDIGYGGLDHVLASDSSGKRLRQRNVNILVLDTEVYSNTGGQQSKSTPRAAVAKFAAAGKTTAKKDLGLMAMTYGSAYVASVALGARDEHTLKAFLEAEAYNGPSLIIAYAHCIAHGIEMSTAMHHQAAIVDAGRWLLYRYDPRRRAEGLNPLRLDSRAPQLPVEQSMYAENRFKLLTHSDPAAAKTLLRQAQQDVQRRWRLYGALAEMAELGEGSGE